MLDKAPTLGADVVMLDLEDAVAPDDKPHARDNVLAARNAIAACRGEPPPTPVNAELLSVG